MDKVNKLAAAYKPKSPPEDYIALARVVKTQAGARRFKTPIGAVITTKVKELAKMNTTSHIEPATGKVKVDTTPERQNHKLFMQRVAELKKSLEKLDKSAIENILKQLEDSQNIPKGSNYNKIRELLKSYLKDKKDDLRTRAK